MAEKLPLGTVVMNHKEEIGIIVDLDTQAVLVLSKPEARRMGEDLISACEQKYDPAQQNGV